MIEQKDEKDEIVASLQEQLRQASQCAARWICHHHAEETRFQRQNHTLGRVRVEIAWIRKRFEAEWTYELGTGEVVLEILERLEQAVG